MNRCLSVLAVAGMWLVLAGPAASFSVSDKLGRQEAPARGEERGENAPPTAAELRAALLYGALGGAALQDGAGGDRRRSIPLAVALSAAVPGLGQVYNRQWIKAAAAVALEAGIIAAYVHYQQAGLDAETDYKAFAHQHWSPPQYARYLNDFKEYLASRGFRQITAADIVVPTGIDFSRPEAWTDQDRGAVRMFFDQIRAIESQAIHPGTGASYSHKLPYFAEQQFYELIGKYFQFAPGWDDYPAWKDGDDFTEAIDPETEGPGGDKINVRGRMVSYAADHAQSNDLLRSASRFTGLLVANHILAAIDAAVFAKLHNDRIESRLGLTYDELGVVRPVATLQVRL